MTIYKSFIEMAEGTGALDAGGGNGMSFVDNMSPVIDRFKGYDIQLFVSDHEPPHVQIKKGSRNLGKLPIDPNDDGALTSNTKKIPKGDLNQLKQHIKENREFYKEKWNEIRERRES